MANDKTIASCRILERLKPAGAGFGATGPDRAHIQTLCAKSALTLIRTAMRFRLALRHSQWGWADESFAKAFWTIGCGAHRLLPGPVVSCDRPFRISCACRPGDSRRCERAQARCRRHDRRLRSLHLRQCAGTGADGDSGL